MGSRSLRSVRLLVFSLALFLPQAEAAYSAGKEAPPKRGGTLTFAMDRDLAIMNPMVSTSSNDKWLRELMFEPLLGIDLKGRVQPNLAESWDVSPDGRVYSFRLRRGVLFHNGQEMAAEDAKFALDYTLNPNNGAYGRVQMNLVERAEAPEKYLLRIYLRGPSAAFLSLLTSIQAFSVVPKGSLQDGISKPASFPPGTGPFKFVEWKPQQHVIMEPFSQYRGGRALVDRLVLRVIRDDTVRFTALRAGDVDMAVRIPLEWARQVADGKFRGLGFTEIPHAGLHRLQFNVAAPPFDNKKLRLAVAHAINKKEVLQAAFHGFGRPTGQKYPEGHSWHIEGVPAVPFDLARARALLQEAGYKGEVITALTDQSAVDQAATTTIQAQLRRIGMNVNLELLDVGAINDRVRKGNFTFRFSSAGFYADPWVTYARDVLCEADPAKRISNNTGYCDKEMDAMLKRAETELDARKRRELFKEILTKLAQDVPELYLGFSPRFFAFRDYVRGYTTDDNGSFRWWGGGLHQTWLDK
jgi:ABC-type transport system substrate-binding protein